MHEWKMHHVGVAVKDIRSAVEMQQKLFGHSILSGPFEDPIQRVTVCFVGSGLEGEVALELITPCGKESPVNRVLARENTAYHVCYEVEDVNRTLDEVRAKGCLVVSEAVPAAAFGGRRIAWFYTPDKQLIEVLER